MAKRLSGFGKAIGQHRNGIRLSLLMLSRLASHRSQSRCWEPTQSLRDPFASSPSSLWILESDTKLFSIRACCLAGVIRAWRLLRLSAGRRLHGLELVAQRLY